MIEMDSNPSSTREAFQRMDLDEIRPSRNNTPSRPHSQSPLRPPLLPPIVPPNPESRSISHSHHPRDRPYDDAIDPRHHRPSTYEPPNSLHSPTYPQRYEQEYNSPLERRPHSEYSLYPTYHEGRRGSVHLRLEDDRSTSFTRRDNYRTYSPPPYPTNSRPHDYSPGRSYSPGPRSRPPIRDPRDRSPTSRAYPYYPERYQSRYSHYRDTRSEYSTRGPVDEFDDRYRRAEAPEHTRSMTVEEYAERADRWDNSLGRYASRHERHSGGDAPFTFAHRERYNDGHFREGYPEDARREPLLPPARDILSVSPESMARRQARREIELVDRSHSAGERSVRYSHHHRGVEREYLARRGSPQRPEEILEGMRAPVHRRRPNDVFLASVMTQHPRSAESTIIQSPSEITRTPATFQPTPPSPKLQGVTSVQPRTGFPSSGLRSTAPPTPPNHRSLQNDSGITVLPLYLTL